jgi:hypothetical protein
MPGATKQWVLPYVKARRQQTVLRESYAQGAAPTDVRAFLADTRSQGHKMWFRVQGPLWLLACVLFAIGFIATFIADHTVLIALGPVLVTFGGLTFMLAQLPTDTVAIRCTALLGVFAHAIYGGQKAIESSIIFARLATRARAGAEEKMCAAADYELSDGNMIATAVVSCAYVHDLAILCAVNAAILLLCAVRFGMAFRYSARLSLIDLWAALAQTQPALCVLRAMAVSFGLHYLDTHASDWFGGQAMQMAASLLVTAVARQPRIRVAARAWLSRRGNVLSAAAGIAALIGLDSRLSLGPVKARVHASLRSIRADLLTREHFESNSLDGSLYSLAEPAAFGNVDVRAHAAAPRATDSRARARSRARTPPSRVRPHDVAAATLSDLAQAFISHSWRDDADTKWALLQEWRAAFVALYGREPTLWFDKACIDPTSNLDAQLSLLPLYAASCESFVILLTPSYLTRMWCVAEIYTWIQVGRSSSFDLRVPALRADAAAVADTIPRALRTTLAESADKLLQKARALASGEVLSAKGDASVRNHARAAPREHNLVESGERLAALAAALGQFDVLAADCTKAADMELLMSVIEISYGTPAAFSRAVQSALLAGAEAALARETARQDKLRARRMSLDGLRPRRETRTTASGSDFEELLESSSQRGARSLSASPFRVRRAYTSGGSSTALMPSIRSGESQDTQLTASEAPMPGAAAAATAGEGAAAPPAEKL